MIQTEHPFEAAPLHPRQSGRLGAGVEIECGADAELHRLDAVHVLGGEIILLGAAETQKHQSRAAGIDTGNYRRVFFRRQRPKRRRLGAGND